MTFSIVPMIGSSNNSGGVVLFCRTELHRGYGNGTGSANYNAHIIDLVMVVVMRWRAWLL